MEQELRQHLIACAALFARAAGLSLATVARRAAGDWRFFDRLEDGVGFTVGKYDEVMRWFSDHWPDSEPWPDAVPRPAAAEEAAA